MRQIARDLKVHVSTIYREIKGNSNIYLSGLAYLKSKLRKSNAHKLKRFQQITPKKLTYITELLKLGMTPEQISSKITANRQKAC